ncbi:MAG: phosphotransferase family protein [Porticoccaceae bacterium]|nr:phosphotransferase family protein [Porticoccaceae bacterium]
MQRALSNWQSWNTSGLQPPCNKPEIVKELLGGRTNKTFLVAAGHFHAVIRVNSPDSVKLGIDRQLEKKILELLQPTGIVPQILFIDDDLLVSKFIEGDCLTDKSLKNSHIMESLSDALGIVQSIEMTDSNPRNYLDYCRSYLDQLSDTVVSPLVVEQIEEAARAVDDEGWEPVICHHDMVPENIIVNDDGLFIIDWEYAALGHPGLDFLRLYGADYASADRQNGSFRSLFKVKQAMDKLWLAVQL